MNRVIYLDHAATTRPFPGVVEAMMPYYGKYYGNASSGYELGEDSKMAIQDARRKIAATLRVPVETILFTSGGTEGNNWVLRRVIDGKSAKKPHIITTVIEHPSVLNTCREMEQMGVDVSYLNVDRYGMVDVRQLAAEIRPDTVLISVMYGNNEIGTIQPIREIGRIAAQRNILFHTDAVQAYGHLPIYPETQRLDFLTASGHKCNGPKGIGFVYIRNPKMIKPMLTGGGQEQGLRSGTENVPGIVGMGEAARISCEDLEKKMMQVRKRREYLMQRIRQELPETIFNGHPTYRLPGNVSICIPGIDGAALTAMLDLEGICVSSGSACSTGKGKTSHVLLAIGRGENESKGAIRITIGEENTKEELESAVQAIKRAVTYLQ